MTHPGADRADRVGALQAERQSAWLYRELAAIEPDPRVAALFAELAAAADGQAAHWADGATSPPFRPTLRARLVIRLARRLGPRRVRSLLAALKIRGLSAWSTLRPVPPAAQAGTPAPHQGPHAMPLTVDDIGRRHATVGGNTLRAAVFGVNDGLVSNAALILGMAGTAVEARTVLAAGAAGLVAGALSMAAGEYVSVRSQRELHEHQIALERDELAEYPAEEAEELALIYAARGLDLATARTVARDLLADPENALDVLAREELGIDPDELASPTVAASASFGAFAIGALLPLLPWLVLPGSAALPVTLGLSGAALFAVGAVLSLFTGRSAVSSGTRMVAIGAAAGAVTWLIGRAVGGAIGI